jgi:hypothetical protein
MIRRRFMILLLATMAYTAVIFVGRDRVHAFDDTTIQGKLVVEGGKGPILQTKEKPVTLTSSDTNLAATLSDPRLSGREVKLEGKFKEGGVFEVHKFFVVRSGSLYRLIYFCDT